MANGTAEKTSRLAIAGPTAAGRALQDAEIGRPGGHRVLASSSGSCSCSPASAVPSDPSDAGEWLVGRQPARRGPVRARARAVRGYRVPLVRRRAARPRGRGRGPVLRDGLPRQRTACSWRCSSSRLRSQVGWSPAPRTTSRASCRPDAWDVGRRTTHELMVVYAIRMAAVFTIATSTILMRTRARAAVARPVRLRDRVRAAARRRLLRLDRARVSGWVLALSVYILDRRGRRAEPAAGEIEIGDGS